MEQKTTFIYKNQKGIKLPRLEELLCLSVRDFFHFMAKISTIKDDQTCPLNDGDEYWAGGTARFFKFEENATIPDYADRAADYFVDKKDIEIITRRSKCEHDMLWILQYLAGKYHTGLAPSAAADAFKIKYDWEVHRRYVPLKKS